MSTGARKARKRAGIPFTKPAKTPTRAWLPLPRRASRGLGLVSGAEILASIVVKGL